MAGEALITSKPDYTRLDAEDIKRVFQLRQAGLTQAAIAQQIGCSQRTVSEWLSDYQDSTDHAKLYLRGQALTMAKNIVKKGRAADHVAALKGLNVLTEQAQSGITIQIGIKDSDVSVALSPINTQQLAQESTG